MLSIEGYKLSREGFTLFSKWHERHRNGQISIILETASTRKEQSRKAHHHKNVGSCWNEYRGRGGPDSHTK